MLWISDFSLASTLKKQEKAGETTSVAAGSQLSQSAGCMLQSLGRPGSRQHQGPSSTGDCSTTNQSPAQGSMAQPATTTRSVRGGEGGASFCLQFSLVRAYLQNQSLPALPHALCGKC